MVRLSNRWSETQPCQDRGKLCLARKPPPRSLGPSSLSRADSPNEAECVGGRFLRLQRASVYGQILLVTKYHKYAEPSDAELWPMEFLQLPRSSQNVAKGLLHFISPSKSYTNDSPPHLPNIEVCCPRISPKAARFNIDSYLSFCLREFSIAELLKLLARVSPNEDFGSHTTGQSIFDIPYVSHDLSWENIGGRP